MATTGNQEQSYRDSHKAAVQKCLKCDQSDHLGILELKESVAGRMYTKHGTPYRRFCLQIYYECPLMLLGASTHIYRIARTGTSPVCALLFTAFIANILLLSASMQSLIIQLGHNRLERILK